MEVGGREVGERPSGPGEVGICDVAQGQLPLLFSLKQSRLQWEGAFD